MKCVCRGNFATFLYGVDVIVAVSTEKQMLGIEARGIVALMTDLSRIIEFYAEPQPSSDAMSVQTLHLASDGEPHLTIALASQPDIVPATCLWVNLTMGEQAFLCTLSGMKVLGATVAFIGADVTLAALPIVLASLIPLTTNRTHKRNHCGLAGHVHHLKTIIPHQWVIVILPN